MLHTRTIIALLLFLLYYSLSTTGQVKKTNQIAAFENLVMDLQQKLKIPSLSYAIVRNGKLIYATGLGWADIENKIPATKKTLYSIASVTKTFTSTLLMQLVEKGKINLQEQISMYDSNFKGDSLKVIHFLTHTSEGAPGTQYKYNGDRFAVLQKVIEKVTGKTYEQVIRENILLKAGMKQSVPGQDLLENTKTFKSLKKQLAKPYTLYGYDEMILSPYPPKKITASSGLLSTAVDLIKYDIALDRQQLVSATSLQKAWTPYLLANGSESPYGLGWFVQKYQGHKFVWHYGQWQTYSALYIKVPQKKLTLIMLASSDGLSKPFALGNGNLFNSAFALAFYRNFLQASVPHAASFKWNVDTTTFKRQIKYREEKYNNGFPDELNAYTLITKYLIGRELRIRKEVHVNFKLLRDYVGTYELLPSPLKFYIDHKKFMVEGPVVSKVQLFAESENKFFLKILNAQIEFVRNKDGIIEECILYLDGNKYRCRKLSS